MSLRGEMRTILSLLPGFGGMLQGFGGRVMQGLLPNRERKVIHDFAVSERAQLYSAQD